VRLGLRVSGDSSICRSIFACRCLFGFGALGLDWSCCSWRTHPTRPPPAPSSMLQEQKKHTLTTDSVPSSKRRRQNHRGQSDIANTHIDSAFLISSLFILSRYLAIRMPAGHSMPPHPAARSWCRSSGLSSRPSKSIDSIVAGMCSGDLT
jgi:hypothetical protein